MAGLMADEAVRGQYLSCSVTSPLPGIANIWNAISAGRAGVRGSRTLRVDT